MWWRASIDRLRVSSQGRYVVNFTGLSTKSINQLNDLIRFSGGAKCRGQGGTCFLWDNPPITPPPLWTILKFRFLGVLRVPVGLLELEEEIN